jgi:GH35 family endo-1,4-beta-xylanase
VAAFEANVKRFGELGLRVYIDELDVSILNVKGDAHKFEVQAQIYHTIVAVILPLILYHRCMIKMVEEDALT